MPADKDAYLCSVVWLRWSSYVYTLIGTEIQVSWEMNAVIIRIICDIK